jgi:hypothetical protein
MSTWYKWGCRSCGFRTDSYRNYEAHVCGSPYLRKAETILCVLCKRTFMDLDIAKGHNCWPIPDGKDPVKESENTVKSCEVEMKAAPKSKLLTNKIVQHIHGGELYIVISDPGPLTAKPDSEMTPHVRVKQWFIGTGAVGKDRRMLRKNFSVLRCCLEEGGGVHCAAPVVTEASLAIEAVSSDPGSQEETVAAAGA